MSNVTPINVANVTFLIDNLGKECHPLQFIREFTHNSIQAILDLPEKKGVILWDYDPIIFAQEGTYKLSLTDTGCGMTSNEMVNLLNQLSSSGGIQSFKEQYGVGAKISGLTTNYEGLVYESWKHGRPDGYPGSAIQLYRDPQEGYGLKREEKEDGEFLDVVPISDEAMPEVIKEIGHGTVVTLLGMYEDHNTMEPPEDVKIPSKWLAMYLNTRYFQIPEGITIQAVEQYNTAHKKNRTIMGQKYYLDRFAVKSGVCKIEDAEVFWWILDPSESGVEQRRKCHDFAATIGHVATLYQNELYEMITDGRSANALLQQFGVIFGQRNVVIYVKPDESHPYLTTNVARTHLLCENKPMPWAKWAEEFSENMPEDLKAYIDSYASLAHRSDSGDSIRQRLKSVLRLYRISRYRLKAGGRYLVDPTSTVQVRKKDTVTCPGPHIDDEPYLGNPKNKKKKSHLLSLLSEDGVEAEKVRADIYPDVQWINLENGTRDPEVLDDRAAKFLPEKNLILANEDFRAFHDMIDYWVKIYGDRAGVREVVTSAVHDWYEQLIVETVISVQELARSKKWARQDIEKALSEEALTAVVMQRYYVNLSVKRELGQRLRSIKGKESA